MGGGFFNHFPPPTFIIMDKREFEWRKELLNIEHTMKLERIAVKREAKSEVLRVQHDLETVRQIAKTEAIISVRGK